MIDQRMIRFNHHKYTYTESLDWARHTWSVAGPTISISFNVSCKTGQELADSVTEHSPSCGIEFHYTYPANHRIGVS